MHDNPPHSARPNSRRCRAAALAGAILPSPIIPPSYPRHAPCAALGKERRSVSHTKMTLYAVLSLPYQALSHKLHPSQCPNPKQRRRLTSVLGMDKGKNTAAKEKEKSYIHWTSEMDYALSSALLEQQALGNKGANGWKGVAFTAGITALWDECQVRMTKEKIMARLKTWNKYFQEVSAMLDTSGFGWDWGRHIVRVDSEDVWADYIKAHPTLKHYKDKVIVNWGDLATLCGTDRANGAAAATGVEAATQIHVEEIADDDAGEGPSHPTRKKVKKISAVDIIAEAVSYIAHNIDGPVETAPVVPPREMTEIEKMYAALARMTDLTEDDLINAMDIVGKDAIKLQIFLVLPEIARRAWLRKQLNEYYNM